VFFFSSSSSFFPPLGLSAFSSLISPLLPFLLAPAPKVVEYTAHTYKGRRRIGRRRWLAKAAATDEIVSRIPRAIEPPSCVIIFRSYMQTSMPNRETERERERERRRMYVLLLYVRAFVVTYQNVGYYPTRDASRERKYLYYSSCIYTRTHCAFYIYLYTFMCNGCRRSTPRVRLNCRFFRSIPMHFLALLLIFHRHLHLPLVTGLYTGYHQQLHVRRELGNREKKNNLGIHIIIIIIKFITGSRVRWIEAEKSLGIEKDFLIRPRFLFLATPMRGATKRRCSTLMSGDRPRPKKRTQPVVRNSRGIYLGAPACVCVCVWWPSRIIRAVVCQQSD
jgi:hypothetical protein